MCLCTSAVPTYRSFRAACLLWFRHVPVRKYCMQGAPGLQGAHSVTEGSRPQVELSVPALLGRPSLHPHYTLSVPSSHTYNTTALYFIRAITLYGLCTNIETISGIIRRPSQTKCSRPHPLYILSTCFTGQVCILISSSSSLFYPPRRDSP